MSVILLYEIERLIIEGMPKSFDMKQFMMQLPDYLEGAGKNEESIGKAVTTLLEVSDFIQSFIKLYFKYLFNIDFVRGDRILFRFTSLSLLAVALRRTLLER